MESVATTDVQRVDRDAIHRRCLAAKALRAGAEYEICMSLLDVLRHGVYSSFGMTSLIEYADRFLGLSVKGTFERIRVARELEKLPRIAEALREGRLCWSVVREITRVARTHNEKEWLAKASGLSAKEMEGLVAERRPGDGPDDPPVIAPRRHRIVLDFNADEFALFLEMIAAVKADHGGPLTNEQALALVSRMILGGPNDEGRSPYQILMTVCEACGRATQDGHGREIAVGPDVVERARCDSQVVRADGRASQEIPPATRRLVMRRDHGHCQVPGCRLATWVDVHHIELRSEQGDHDPSNLLVLCSAHHQALHEGRLAIEGRVGETLRFLSADGSPYGQARDPSVPQLFVDVYSALRHLGCKEGQARDILAQVQPHVGLNEPVADVVKKCLMAMRWPPPVSP